MTGGNMRGTDRDRAAETVREVERLKTGSGAINLTSSVFGGRAGGARAMILVNLFKSAPISLRELQIGSVGIRMGSMRVAQEAYRCARAGGSRGHDRKQSSTRMPFNLESKRHEQKSRGFAGL